MKYIRIFDHDFLTTCFLIQINFFDFDFKNIILKIKIYLKTLLVDMRVKNLKTNILLVSFGGHGTAIKRY